MSFIMIGRPPGTTLCPYATPFLSPDGPAGHARLLGPPRGGPAHAGGGHAGRRGAGGAEAPARLPGLRAVRLLLRRHARGKPASAADRRSLRGGRLGAARPRPVLPAAGRD